MLNPPSGAQFATGDAVRLTGDPALPAGQTDQANPGVTVLSVSLPAGTNSLQMLFSPQWPNQQQGSANVKNVPLSRWSLTSHD